ncbi:MAG: hypothetical protein GX781_03355 [Clostridiales bacterium]|nr:hypothetical protein [Clostridiales bacterium]
MIVQTLGGHALRLREPHDLSFIENYGKIFNIYDEHTCGMLSFGLITSEGRRIYLKYAGAKTINYPSDPIRIVQKLRQAMKYYHTLRHAALIKYISGKDFGTSCLCVFEWAEGLSLGPDPVAYSTFRHLPLLKRLGLFDMVCDFHLKAENEGIVIAGLSDSHMNFHMQTQQLLITNIDNYLPLPSINTRGRLPGSPLYLPPEGYQIGAAIDETSNVYTLAALSHSFFGDKINKKKEAWEASDLLYEISKRALNENRNLRQQNTDDFLAQWRDAVLRTRFV